MPFERTELSKFTNAGNEIVRAVGTTFEEFAEGESGLILKAWAGLIRASSEAEAEVRGRNRVLSKLGLTGGRDVTINAGLKGPEGIVFVKSTRMYKRNGGGKGYRFYQIGKIGHNAGQFTPHTQRVADQQWAEAQQAIQSFQAQAGVIAIARRTVGLARQSVIQIGDSLGIMIDRISGAGLSGSDVVKARNAVASDGQTYQNGYGVRTKSGTQFSIELVNQYPNLREAKVDIALAQAVGGRVQVMTKILMSKFRPSLDRVARQLPYLQIRG